MTAYESHQSFRQYVRPITMSAANCIMCCVQVMVQVALWGSLAHSTTWVQQQGRQVPAAAEVVQQHHLQLASSTSPTPT
jgi:hypothetical protein